jgi:hypothetical protein
MKLVPGPDNDIVRIFIDGEDIGNKLGVCLETWENYYRDDEKREPPVTNSLGFRSDNGGLATRPTKSPACWAGATCSTTWSPRPRTVPVPRGAAAPLLPRARSLPPRPRVSNNLADLDHPASCRR